MKALTGAVAALLTIVLVFFGFGLRGNSSADGRAVAAGQVAYAQPAANARVQPVNGFASGQVVPVSAPQNDEGWQAQAAAAGQQPVLVNCGPGTQTLVRPVWVNGQQVSQVECLATAGGVAYPQQARPVAYESSVYDARMTRPAYSSYTPAPRRVVRRSQRSWGKTALVIGGTTAGGAGIGGLIGGKKGALIGAAIGGGAGTLFEVGKRH